MNRLTDKISLGKYGQDNMELFGYDNKALPNQEMHCSVLHIFDKLGRLEDLEEELGIDLITLFIALKNGVYYRFDKRSEITKMKKPMLRVIDDELCLIAPKWITTTWMNVKLKDYGKTWALTKEELE